MGCDGCAAPKIDKSYVIKQVIYFNFQSEYIFMADIPQMSGNSFPDSLLGHCPVPQGAPQTSRLPWSVILFLEKIINKEIHCGVAWDFRLWSHWLFCWSFKFSLSICCMRLTYIYLCLFGISRNDILLIRKEISCLWYSKKKHQFPWKHFWQNRKYSMTISKICKIPAIFKDFSLSASIRQETSKHSPVN